MANAKRCPECEQLLPNCEFDPRHNSVFEGEDVPPMDDVWRQSRCGPCNRVYGRRRSLFEGSLQRQAEELGVEIAARNVHRVIEVEGPTDDIEPLEQAIAEFNQKLPLDRCDLERHGMRLVRVPVGGRDRQLSLFETST